MHRRPVQHVCALRSLKLSHTLGSYVSHHVCRAASAKLADKLPSLQRKFMNLLVIGLLLWRQIARQQALGQQ